MMPAADSLRVLADSLPADTLTADTIAPGEALSQGISLTPYAPVHFSGSGGLSVAMSCVLLVLFLLFCVVCLRFKNNARYIRVLWRDLTEVRTRSNLFDDTVRETSFLILLNLLWVASAGVLLYSLIQLTVRPSLLTPGGTIPDPAPQRGILTFVCMGGALAYTLFMLLAYWIVGNVFSDSARTAMWVKGYAASQGLLGFIFFPIALMCVGRPEWQIQLLIAAGVAFALAKGIFVWKGLRIFFTQLSSWVLFLYYLCSLEIVPLILTYFAVMLLCGLLL